MMTGFGSALTPSTSVPPRQITKKLTGIAGFDEISYGGLPEGRLIGIMGGPGTGKTIFALQTLVSRARLVGECGVFVSFEEPSARLRSNACAFQWDFEELDGAQIILFDGRLPPNTLISGDFDLTGLLSQVASIVEQIGATNVVFDGLDILLTSLPDIARERQELHRIDQWGLDHTLTCVITGKSSIHDTREVARQDYLHYLTDMVLVLEGLVNEGAFTRILRILKYRGSDFLANAFPAVITAAGLQVIAKSEAYLSHPTFEERLSSGMPDLDELLEGGFRRGTITLVTGSPGTAKTSMAGQFASAACKRGESVLYVSFDESADQITNNLRTIAIDLDTYRRSGKLTFISFRSSSRSPDHLYVTLRSALAEFRPSCLIIDPISALIRQNYPVSEQICEHLLDDARALGITTFCTWLSGASVIERELAVSTPSTIADNWIHLTNTVRSGERNRELTIVKSRGTDHSNQVRELIVGKSGLGLAELYTAEGEVLMGSARAQREANEERKVLEQDMDQAQQQFEIAQALATLRMQQMATEAQIEWKRKELEALNKSSTVRVDGQKEAAADRLRFRNGGKTE
jgi:circadian clock protein KaiC